MKSPYPLVFYLHTDSKYLLQWSQKWSKSPADFEQRSTLKHKAGLFWHHVPLKAPGKSLVITVTRVLWNELQESVTFEQDRLNRTTAVNRGKIAYWGTLRAEFSQKAVLEVYGSTGSWCWAHCMELSYCLSINVLHIGSDIDRLAIKLFSLLGKLDTFRLSKPPTIYILFAKFGVGWRKGLADSPLLFHFRR